MTFTNSKIKTRITTLLLGLVFIFSPAMHAAAITEADCNPWPDNSDQILACIDFYSQNPQLTKPVGSNPSNPTILPFDGVGGIASAYSDKLNQTLVVSPVSDKIKGIFTDPVTVKPVGNEFRIDAATTLWRGSPKAVYANNLDKFFVAWEDGRPCTNCRSTYGRILDGKGAPQGNEIVVSTKTGFLEGLDYDANNKKFVVIRGTTYPEIKTIDENGNVDARTIVVSDNPAEYQGQTNIAVDAQADEYWVSYLTATGSGGQEDDRVWFARFNAKTGEPVGTPVQVSQTRLGHNNIIGTKIASSTLDGTGVIAWTEYNRDGIAGVWGRGINSDGTLGNEFPLFTASTTQTSDGYGLSALAYNSYTDSFFVASGDWNGGANTAEFDSSGAIYNSDQAISPVGLGSFNINLATTQNGAVTLTSQDYKSIAGTSQKALSTVVTAPTPGPGPTAPGKINLGPLSASINQVYIWSLGAAALLALFMIVIGGYLTLTSAGNAQRASRGKEFIVSSLIGLVLLFGSYILLRTINPDLVDFSNNSGNVTQPGQ